MATEIQIQRPTVLIGAGGTGKQTLLLLRRMFYERYGVSTLPHVAHVVIDTDPARHHLDGEKYDEFDREVDFKDDEMLVTPVGDALKNIRQNRSQYPHIDAWLDRALDKHGNIQDGAGQIRALGRLAFFQHYEPIRQQLERAYRKVTDAKVRKAALDDFKIKLADDPGVDTWLIFSVAGGTGSGMFLDLAFLAKRIAETHGGSTPDSIILLPTAFSSDLPQHPSTAGRHRLFANSYAALMELETYNFQHEQNGELRADTAYPTRWNQQLFTQGSSDVGPVFATSWLIDNEPIGGGGRLHNDRMSLCHMIAEWLFLQYGSTAPALRQVIRSNRANALADAVEIATINIPHAEAARGEKAESDPRAVTLHFSRRYSSFGLSKIYVPTTNLASQAYARLVGDIVAMWDDRPTAGDPRLALNRLLPRLFIPGTAQVAGFPRDLARRVGADNAGDSMARRFDRLISDKHQKLKGENFQPGAEADARDWFNREIMLKLLDQASKGKNRGEISREINPENLKTARDAIKVTLEDYVRETLKTPGERLRHAEAGLRLLVSDYKQLADEATTAAARQEARGRRLQGDLETLLIWASDHKGFDRATTFEAAFAKMKERADVEFYRQCLLAAAAVATDVAEHIGIGRTFLDDTGREVLVDTGLLHDLGVLRSTFARLREHSAERIKALRRQAVSSLNSRAPATDSAHDAGSDAELDQLYVNPDNSRVDRDSVEHYEEQLYVALGHSGLDSPWYLRQHAVKDIRRPDAERLEDLFEQMLGFANKQLSHLPMRMEDAILRFYQKHHSSGVDKEYESELDRVAARGTPWLPAYSHNLGGSDEFRHRQQTLYLACSPDAAPGPRKDLLEHVEGRAVISGPLDTVYFEGELGGVPLCSVRHIDLYRNAYVGYQTADEALTRVVHTELDLEKYVDLIPYSSDEMDRRRKAIRAFIRGIVSGVVRPDGSASPGRLEWQFAERSRSFSQPVTQKLARYRTAIQTLSQPGSTLYGALIGEIDQRYGQDIDQSDLGRIYLAVEEMRHRQPIPGTEWRAAAESVLADMRAKYGEAVVESAGLAAPQLEVWGVSIAGAGPHPFWTLRSLTEGEAG